MFSDLKRLEENGFIDSMAESFSCSPGAFTTLSCDPMDVSLPGSSVHEISQERILEWVDISFAMDLPDPRIEPASLVLQGDYLLLSHQGSPSQLYPSTK